MPKQSVARRLLKPEAGTFRAAFLYVGQGDCTLLAIPYNGKHKYALIDINHRAAHQGMDVLAMLHDLLGNGSIDIFINTHPHKDHIKGLDKLHTDIGVKEIWHSGHVSSGKHSAEFRAMLGVMENVGWENVYVLSGTNDKNHLHFREREFPYNIEKDQDLTKVKRKVGDAGFDYHVLAPASYVFFDHAIKTSGGKTIEERHGKNYDEIHEHCGVLKFSYGGKHVLVLGDADYRAWSGHIKYHWTKASDKGRVRSDVMRAAHHGSNTFFWKDTKCQDKAYASHLRHIAPGHIVVSAAKATETTHTLPDKEAMGLYTDTAGKNVHHLGRKKDGRECVIVDITKAGKMDVRVDTELAAAYRAQKS